MVHRKKLGIFRLFGFSSISLSNSDFFFFLNRSSIGHRELDERFEPNFKKLSSLNAELGGPLLVMDSEKIQIKHGELLMLLTFLYLERRFASNMEKGFNL
jgi:hypothetical protein